MEICFIRHGSTALNDDKKIQGQLDHPLSIEGIVQTLDLRSQMRGTKFDQIYCSPLIRATQTAKYVFNQPFKILDNLKEIDLGILEGRSKYYLENQYHQMIVSIENDPIFEGHGGETSRHFIARCISTFQQILDEGLVNGYQRIAIITHEGVMRVILYTYLKISQRKNFDHCQIYQLNRHISSLSL